MYPIVGGIMLRSKDEYFFIGVYTGNCESICFLSVPTE